MILMAAEGVDNQDIATTLGVPRQKVGRWRNGRLFVTLPRSIQAVRGT